MNSYVSMLRGINVSGHKKVTMAELKQVYVSLGHQNVRTYLQSGNVVSEHPGAPSPSLALEIEKSLRQRFGFDIPVFIRSGDELQRLIKENPFAERVEDWIHVTFLYNKPAVSSIDRINQAAGEGEAFSMGEREVYLYCPKGYGRTKLSNSFFERTLKVTATTRNWRTTKALHSMAKRA